MAAQGDFGAWLGKVEEATDSVPSQLAESLAATLDLSAAERERRSIAAGGTLPPLWHWLAFSPKQPMQILGSDGHPKRGGFLPPVPLERRMWAGGRLSFTGALHIGEQIHRRSEIVAIKEKTGGSGRMVFVTVRHLLSGAHGPAIEEEHDIVYVAIPERYTPPPPVAPPAATLWSESVPIDPVRLFRYSAVTFNGHRIHYDITYTTDIEHYPGLVVHGPLQATLLMEAACRQQGGAVPKTFRFRGVRPLFHFDSLTVMGTPVVEDSQELAVVNGDNHVTMQAQVAW
jgi:3-methylfumaryl-CoA hydratase